MGIYMHRQMPAKARLRRRLIFALVAVSHVLALAMALAYRPPLAEAEAPDPAIAYLDLSRTEADAAPRLTPTLQAVTWVPLPIARFEVADEPDVAVQNTGEVSLPSATANALVGAEAVVVSKVQYIRPPIRCYPAAARRDRLEGAVSVRVRVDEQGRPATVDVGKSSGYRILDLAARDCVLAALFRPYEEGGVTRQAIVTIPIHFSLTLRTAAR
jgi:TonB family protein